MQAYTAHYINADWELKSIVLALHHTTESHTGENLKALFTYVTEKWKASDKAIAATTDGAANFLKAARELKEEHLLDEQVRCACHTIHLCVTQALEGKHIPEAEPTVAPLLRRIRKLVSDVRDSGVAAQELMAMQVAHPAVYVEQLIRDEEAKAMAAEEMLDDDGRAPSPSRLKLLRDVCTRWGRTYDCLTRLLQLRVPFEAALEKIHHNDWRLTDADWTVVSQLVCVLRPFANVTKTLAGEKSPTISLVWPKISALFAFLGPRDDQGRFTKYLAYEPAVQNVVRSLFVGLSLDDRFAKPGRAQQFAALLDPRTHRLGFLGHERRAQRERDDVIDQFVQYARQFYDDAPSVEVEADDEQMDQSAEEHLGLEPVEVKRAAPRRVLETPVEHEWREYFKEPEIIDSANPLLWWKEHESKFPKLAQLAKRYLCIPASSAPSERTFSNMNIVVSNRRARLLPARAERLCLLRLNREYLPQ